MDHQTKTTRSQPLARLSGIKFSSSRTWDIITQSVFEHEGSTASVKTSEKSIVKPKDLYNPRMGVPFSRSESQSAAGSLDAKLIAEGKCPTCKGHKRGPCDVPDTCDGHFGHIELPTSIYHPYYVRRVAKVLQSICLHCSRVPEKKKRRNIIAEYFEYDDREEPVAGKAKKKPVLSQTTRKGKEGTGKAFKSSTVTGKKRKRNDASALLAHLGLDQMFQGLAPTKEEFDNNADANLNGQVPGVPLHHCKEEPADVEFDGPPQDGRCGVECAPPLSEQTRAGGHNADKGLVQEDKCKYCAVGDKGVGQKFPKITVRVAPKVVRSRGKIDTILLIVDEKAGVLPEDFWSFVESHPVHDQGKTRVLLPYEASRIIEKIPSEDHVKLNWDEVVSRPKAFILQAIPVTPNCNRLIMEDWSSTLMPRIFQGRGGPNSKLEAVVSKVKQITSTARSGIRQFDISQTDSEDLQLVVARHLRACKVVEFGSKPSETQETGGSLELKWLKTHVLSKRSNHSARSIINGDPGLSIGEIGIPQEMASRLTVEERVTRLNVRNWCKLLDDTLSGRRICPGLLQLRKNETNQCWDLHVMKLSRKVCKVAVGDIIIRCLKDGDVVFANRPPSLHKHSLIALTVKIHPFSTFSINPLICAPFEADFDGDAFHIFVPQCIDSMVELRELMSVSSQMVCPQGHQPLIGLTEDSLLGAHRLTSSHIFFNRVDMNQLSMFCSSIMPRPAIIKAPKCTGPLWTGKQLFSMSLPDGLDYGSADEGVLIRDGEILTCTGGSSWLQRSVTGIVKAICDHCGPETAVEHLNCVQRLLQQWLLICGFSVSLLDYHVASDSQSRSSMLLGVRKALKSADQASLRQALKLDSQVQLRMLSPDDQQTDYDGSINTTHPINRMSLNHPGCFGLLLGDNRSSQKIKALQRIAVERFQFSTPVIENLLIGYIDQNNSLLAMVQSGSKGSMSKFIQQAGCVGLQLYKGESLLPVDSCNKLNYFQRSLLRHKEAVFFETDADASQPGYWESRGVVASSFFDGLKPVEFFLHVMSSRCSLLRKGIEEPNQIMKNLMLFMRDMHIAYDGTVRNCTGKHIIQFQYGGVKESGDQNSEPGTADPALHWKDSYLAGEPVGALAATAIAEPAYSVKLESFHQSQLLRAGPVQLLQETLFPRFKSPLKLKDRCVILRLFPGFGSARRALKLQRELQRVILKNLIQTVAIEFSNDTGIYNKVDVDHNHKATYKEVKRLSRWSCHLVLSKKLLEEYELDVSSVIDRLNIMHNGSKKKDLPSIIFSNRSQCSSHVHKGRVEECLMFFPHIFEEVSPASALKLKNQTPPKVASGIVGKGQRAFLSDTMKPGNQTDFETVRDVIMPAVLNTTVKGHEEIETVNILWEDGGCASRLPQLAVVRPYSNYRGQRIDPGELVLEVHVKEPRGAGKRGSAWNHVKLACVMMDMIDWSRSSPYSVQEIGHTFGLEAAHLNIMKRLTLAVKNMGKPVREEHLTLVADTMTHSGVVTGLSLAGYRDFSNRLSVSTPFTEAAFQEPRKKFLDMAAQGASDNLAGALASTVWGQRIPLGTGTEFDLRPTLQVFKGQKLPIDFNSLLVETHMERKHEEMMERAREKTKRMRKTFLTGLQGTKVEMENFKSPSSQILNPVSLEMFESEDRFKKIHHSLSSFSYEEQSSFTGKEKTRKRVMSIPVAESKTNLATRYVHDSLSEEFQKLGEYVPATISFDSRVAWPSSLGAELVENFRRYYSSPNSNEGSYLEAHTESCGLTIQTREHRGHAKSGFRDDATRVIKHGSAHDAQLHLSMNNNIGLTRFERIWDQQQELQKLLHSLCRAGERVAGDAGKMILDEVLVHHPNKDIKIGCGVDFIKVDYHPEYPASKCFHVVRKDGSTCDFSIRKCLENKLKKLNSSRPTGMMDGMQETS